MATKRKQLKTSTCQLPHLRVKTTAGLRSELRTGSQA